MKTELFSRDEPHAIMICGHGSRSTACLLYTSPSPRD